MRESEPKNEMASEQQEPEQQGETALVEVTQRSKEEILDKGERIFFKMCSACHGKSGQGSVGPNLTDHYWIYGGTFDDMKVVVLEGVIEKGMISYKNQLSNQQIDDILTYIQSLQGTNPPNAKAPQGKKYIPETTAVE